MKKYNAIDYKSLQQAMSIFSEEYIVIRKRVERYNDKGRFDPVESTEIITGSIQEDMNELSLDGKGNGENEFENRTFTLTLVYPQYVSKGDIIITKEFGRLRVTGKSSNTSLRGTSSYSLIATGSAKDEKNSETFLY